jgi:hypothetical protein
MLFKPQKEKNQPAPSDAARLPEQCPSGRRA